jgi:hypothetical protein
MSEKCFLCGKETVVAYKNRPMCIACCGKLKNYEDNDIIDIQVHISDNVQHIEPCIEYYDISVDADNGIYFEHASTEVSSDSYYYDSLEDKSLGANIEDVILFAAKRLELLTPIV